MYDEPGIGTMEKPEGEACEEINCLINRILFERLEQAKKVIRENRNTADRLVEMLTEKCI